MSQIAIITPVGQYNLGNRLQNYALTQICLELGYSVETLSIVEDGRKFLEKRIMEVTGLWPVALGLCQREKNLHLLWKRYIAFRKFSDQYIPTRYCGPWNIPKLANEYEYFLIGSDQIWNPYHNLARGCDFANFARMEQKIAVAASFGVSELPPDRTSCVTEWLKEIRYLSVREKSGANLIRQLTGREARVLIDPALALRSEDWRGISNKPQGVPLDHPYVLTYFLGKKSAWVEDQIAQYTCQMHAKEYPLLDKSFPALYIAGPAEFLWLIEHAALVCTDSFHAVAFSILFGRPFWVFQRDGDGGGMEDRISTILETVGLRNRLLTAPLQQEMSPEWDCTGPHLILEREREKFWKYLRDALFKEENMHEEKE